MAVLESIITHARAAPSRTAVVHNGQALSYRRLAALILLARRHLEARGVGRKGDGDRDRLAVLCVHSLIDGWIIGQALRSLGVTTVNARSMGDIAGFGASGSGRGPMTLISTPAEAAAWPGLDAAAARTTGRPPVLLAAEVFQGWEAIDLDEAGAIGARAPGAHLLLTSGTTGVYKTVSMDTAAEDLDGPPRAALFGFTRDSVVNVFDFGLWTSVGHNVGVCVWNLGATLVLQQTPHRDRFGPTPGMTHALVTPHMLAGLLAKPPAARDDDLTLFVGAGVLSPAQWRAARETVTTDVRTWIGATETGAICGTAIGSPDDLTWHHIDPTRDVQVVDDADRPLGPGRSGLVRARPLGVSGYLGDPEATAAFFRHGYFYSGDLGMLRDDGRLALLGRVTDIINVMGDKLATLPIETLLQDRLGAEAVCVFSAPGEHGEEVHVVIRPRRAVSAEELRGALAAALPPNAPTHVHALADFPRNHMGKIERAELKRRVLAKPATAG
jgi:acyl-coenzyme A synthetase/AMP-(fatty) acid ligase